MSKELIAKARELSAAACEGPWRHCCASGNGCGGLMVWEENDQEEPVAHSGKEHVNAKNNMAFIAESRTLLPALANLAESEGKRADEAERERAKSDAAYEALFRRTTTAINAMRTERDAAVAELAMLKVQVESMQPVLDAVHALQKANALREGPTWAAAFHPSLLAIINIQLPPKEQP